MTERDENLRSDLSQPLEDEHDPPGENQGINARFTVDDVARHFDVARERVVRAFAGEFHLDDTDTVNSTQAQHLSEVIIGNRTQEEREAALMKLGAYTPRRDTIEPSVWEKPSGEDDDTLLAPDSVRRSDLLGDTE